MSAGVDTCALYSFRCRPATGRRGRPLRGKRDRKRTSPGLGTPAARPPMHRGLPSGIVPRGVLRDHVRDACGYHASAGLKRHGQGRYRTGAQADRDAPHLREGASRHARRFPAHLLIGCDHRIHHALGERVGDIVGQTAIGRQLPAEEGLLRDDGRGGSDPIFAACLSLLHVIPPVRRCSVPDIASVPPVIAVMAAASANRGRDLCDAPLQGQRDRLPVHIVGPNRTRHACPSQSQGSAVRQEFCEALLRG